MSRPNHSLAELTDLATRILVAAGTLSEHAAEIADVLVFAEARGIASHGLMALGHYVQHMTRVV